MDTTTVQRGHEPTDPEDDFGITVEGFEYYMYFIYFLIKPHLHVLKNQHGMPNFCHRASFTRAETTSRG